MSVAELIVWIIGAFAAAGVICQWAAWLRYKVEFDHLKRTEIALSSMDIGTIDALISGSGASGSSIIGHRLYQVRNIANSSAPPSVADLSMADFEPKMFGVANASRWDCQGVVLVGGDFVRWGRCGG